MQADKKLNILIWAFPSWDGDYMKSTVELAKELAVRHRVLYIDYAFTIKDVLLAKLGSYVPVGRILKKNRSLKTITLDNGGAISVLSLPPIIPLNWTGSKAIYRFIERLNYKIVSKRIKTALSEMNFTPDVVINAFNPFFGNAILKLFPECPVIYYCYDNIESSIWAAKHGGRLEQEFAVKVNAAVFSSDALREAKAWKIPKYVVKNGVDLRLFKQSAQEPDINKERPIIGYIGTIDERLDFDLLEKLAEANPQFDFHFAGRVITTLSAKLQKLPNVRFFGPVKPESLSGIMQHFSAGMVPFVKNDFTKNIYPMKVNEYLAMGIPIVSTGFAHFHDLNDYIEIADDEIDFTAKIKEVIRLDNDLLRQQRKAKAYSNSWEQKSIEFENILLQYAA
jgi:glycosyltransferase involved in cell wall biosynthesis